MGPGNNSGLPNRPKLSWDIRSTPWTDGRGSQEGYARAVKLWEQFHDILPEANPNRVSKELRGICLKSQLFGCAYDLCSSISDDDIASDFCAQKIIPAIYIRDSLSVTSQVYNDLNQLRSVKRNATDSYKSYEDTFASQVAKFSAHVNELMIHESLLAMMLMSGSNIDDAQRIQILLSASSKTVISSTATVAAILTAITYEKVASILRQCDCKYGHSSNIEAVHANLVNNPSRRQGRSICRGSKSSNNSNSNNKNRREKLSPDELRKFKLKTKCTKCGNYGHLEVDHLNNGTIRDGLPSILPAEKESNNQDNNNNRNNNGSNNENNNSNNNGARLNIRTFMASYGSNSESDSMPVSAGPVVDVGAPHSAIGLTKLRIFQSDDHSTFLKLDPKPAALRSYKYWQLGIGNHSSDRRPILGSVKLSLISDSGNEIQICHLVVQGSSQWVLGRNLTR